MYNQTAPASGNRTNSQFTRQRGHRRGRRSADSRRENLRLFQLLVCLALFLAVFIGKGIFPDRVLRVKDELLTMITANTDFRAALAGLGSSLADSGAVWDDLGEFCVEVFGGEPVEELPPAPAAAVPAPARSELEGELAFLNSTPDRPALADHYWRASAPLRALSAPVEEAPPEEQEVRTQAPAAIPAAGTVVLYSDYDGEPLPERYTMDQVSLGELVTAAPVMGKLTSPYGYRDHPITGEYQFHGGADISGNEGDPVGAFADGVVEYIGENDSYGLYLQIDHGNGVKSFYAHCSKLCVSKGQAVKLGEKVAEIGATGVATGPHLHLELKYNKMHLNPAYYVEFVSAE